MTYTADEPKPFVERRGRRWCFTDLITDHKTGKMRETLFWSNIGKAAALGGFAYKVNAGTDTDTLWAIVMGVLTAHEIASRWLSQKLGITVGSTTTESIASSTTTVTKP